MPLFEVAIVKKPSKKEIEEGITEQLVFGPKAIIAKDHQGAGIAAVLSGAQARRCGYVEVRRACAPFCLSPNSQEGARDKALTQLAALAGPRRERGRPGELTSPFPPEEVRSAGITMNYASAPANAMTYSGSSLGNS